ncbi:RsiV family protein [Desulfitobacterium sp. Sab5]|uniref:RsiV family protein n=1 Tax=Desulfitobacterium nosdiversum TaxID=3375356 RepID=UPI003CEC9E05
MKKHLCLFLVALLPIANAVGCSSAATTDTKPADKVSNVTSAKSEHNKAESNESAPQELDQKTTQSTLSIEKRMVRKSILNDYNATIDYNFSFVQLSGTYKGIDNINKYYSLKEKTDFFGKEYNDYFNIPNSSKDNYFFKADFRAEAQIGDILSISGDGDSWAGGVSNPILYGDVFDLNTGEKLTLDDVFKVRSDEYLELIYNKITENINKEIAEGNNRYNFNDAYSEDCQTEIKKEFKPDNFYLTDKFLVIFYPKYSLGAGAAGTFKYEIPLDLIKEKLKIETSKVRLF